MILVVGGLGSGKREYILSTLGYSKEDFALRMLDDKPVMEGLDSSIRQEGGFCEDWLDWLVSRQVVSCNEVGCGVVPMDPAERRWREEVGRACARLAAEADTVVRLVCGIPQVIKGTLP